LAILKGSLLRAFEGVSRPRTFEPTWNDGITLVLTRLSSGPTSRL
jgi:hypothetical protein